MNQTMRSQAGYSLAEMLTVVAIIGVLALVMVPNFMSFFQSNKMKSSMRNFTTDLRSTRQMAIAQGRQAALSFKTGTNQRSYDLYLGDKPFNSLTWTAKTGPGTNRPTKVLENIAYFPANAAPNPQTFTDDIDCSVSPCVTICPTCSPPTGSPDAKLEVIFFPDGRVKLPTGLTTGTITIKTDLNRLAKPLYAIAISPSGRALALEEVLFANLGAPPDGTVLYCSDCTSANPCTTGGSGGAVARRTGGSWACN